MLQGLFKGGVGVSSRQKERQKIKKKRDKNNNKKNVNAPVRCWHSQQLLQRPLLEGLIGAVDDVGLKVVRGVVLDDIADVPDYRIVIVTPLEVLKKPKNAERERERGRRVKK